MSSSLTDLRKCASAPQHTPKIFEKSRESLRDDFSCPPTGVGSGVGVGVGVAVAVAGGAGLVIGGKSNSAVRIDPDSGEVLGVEKVYDSGAARVQRFALQSAVGKLLPNSSTARCLKRRQKGKEIQVIQSNEHGTTSYCGLQTCSNVWRCPVCAAKISERRRVELKSAVAQHTKCGGQVLFMTLTHPHSRADDLAEMLDKQAFALKGFTGGRGSRRIFDEMGVIGSIRAFEVTHGRRRKVSHGWHPHYHVLLFCRSGVDLATAGDALFLQWQSACVRAGLRSPNREHGFSLADGSNAAAYASKWGIDSEMTRGHTKKKTDGETPFDLLRSYEQTGDKQAGALFVEFAEAFRGKRQLFWSKGLKAHFGTGETTDEELAAKVEDEARILGVITLDQWRDVLRADGRGLVLQLAASGGWPAVTEYLDRIGWRSEKEMDRGRNRTP